MMLSLQPKQEYSIGQKVPDNFLWSLNYRSYVETDADLTAAKEILQDSYAQRSK